MRSRRQALSSRGRRNTGAAADPVAAILSVVALVRGRDRL
jgi:hypothetical protein